MTKLRELREEDFEKFSKTVLIDMAIANVESLQEVFSKVGIVFAIEESNGEVD